MKMTKLLASAAVTTAMLVTPATAFAGFYPADRATYTCTVGTTCPGADHVVFNSFTNNPLVGDERPFFAGSLNGANVVDRAQVKDGDEVVLRIFVHNNADESKVVDKTKDYVAKNTRVRVIVPEGSRNDQNMVAFISADNANPGTINDTMSAYGDRAFTVTYVAGSAEFTNKPDGVTQQTVKVNDSIVTTGASLGDIKGCFQYSGFVTLKVKVSMPTPVTPVTTPTPAKPATPAPAAQPTKLVNAGPGEVAALFGGVSAAGAFAHRLFLSRRARS